MQVVHHEGQRLHNELENVSSNPPNLKSAFFWQGDIYPATPGVGSSLNPVWCVKLSHM